ncbi:MAG: glycosyltransferase family 4 protein [Anaerolineae bacterium]|nr:glycosyltransferase family 4 protein [Anaerolineae bacterium]
MRIVVNGWFWDAPTTGSGQYVRRLVTALAALEPSLELVVLLPYTLPPRAERPAGHARITLMPHPTGRTDVHKVWWEQVSVPGLARRMNADLLHIPYWAPPASRAVPTVVTVHDLIPLLLPAYRGNAMVRLYTALVCATTSRARMVLTDSEASRGDILEHLHLPSNTVRAIHLAVDKEFTAGPDPRDRQIREGLGCPPRYSLYLGGFDVRKNLRALFGAFSTARRACEDAELVVAGRLPTSDTAFTPDPRRLAREAGIPDEAVHFLGFVQEGDKPALLRGARAFVYPSMYEGFGYPPLEALACGTPVVGCDQSSLPEVVGNAGVLLPPQDVEGMAGALIQLLIDDKFHAALKSNAVQQAQKFSWKRAAAETLAGYAAALT